MSDKGPTGDRAKSPWGNAKWGNQEISSNEGDRAQGKQEGLWVQPISNPETKRNAGKEWATHAEEKGRRELPRAQARKRAGRPWHLTRLFPEGPPRGVQGLPPHPSC